MFGIQCLRANLAICRALLHECIPERIETETRME
jgi:hypothetical protein